MGHHTRFFPPVQRQRFTRAIHSGQATIRPHFAFAAVPRRSWPMVDQYVPNFPYYEILRTADSSKHFLAHALIFLPDRFAAFSISVSSSFENRSENTVRVLFLGNFGRPRFAIL